MKINLSQLIAGKVNSINVDFYYTLDNNEIYENYDIVKASPLHFFGNIYRKNEVYYVELDFTGDIVFKCNRCLEEFARKINGHLYTSIITNKENETDENLFLQGDMIDLSSFIEEAITLSLPMKVLCNDKCKGLCSICGENLNVKKCNCNKEKIDPRLEKLKNFFSNNEEV